MKYIPLKYFQNQTLLSTQESLYFGDSLRWNFRVSVSFLQLKFFFPFLILFKTFIYQGSWPNSQYMCLSYRNQSIDLQLQCKSIYQFVYERNIVWKWDETYKYDNFWWYSWCCVGGTSVTAEKNLWSIFFYRDPETLAKGQLNKINSISSSNAAQKSVKSSQSK